MTETVDVEQGWHSGTTSAEEVAERLKENLATTSIPLFALADRAELGSQAGLFDACVPKPLDAAALAAALGGVAHPGIPAS